MQDLLNLTSFQYWNFTERQHSFQEVQILIPPTWNFSSCLAERRLKTGHLTDLDLLLVESQPYTDDLPWSLQVARTGPNLVLLTLILEFRLRLQRREGDGVEEVYQQCEQRQ